MNSEIEVCPKCQNDGVSPWAWLYASWPFYTRCKKCGVKLRTRTEISRWLDLLVQIFAQVVFIAFTFIGAKIGDWPLGFIAGGIVGGALGAVVFLTIPAFFSKFEVLPEE